jgi:GNAT superfamily N-acetyltransferase
VTQPGPTLREVVEPDDSAIAGAHRLLRRTFAKEEMVGRSEWRDSLRERQARVWADIRWHLVVAEHRGRVVGVASGTYLGNVNAGVIGYLAVSPGARGHGVGSTLRAKLRNHFRRDAREVRGAPLQAVIGEVRHDNPWLANLARRKHVLALDFGYAQPSLRREDHPVRLILYYESLGRVRQRLPAALVRKLIYTIWRRVYRIPRPLADREFRRMLADLAAETSIGRLTAENLGAASGAQPR